MKNVLEIYSQYKLMPNLQTHQLRVAAVAKLICNSFKTKINKNGVIKVCLFHDMGNMIKFDLKYFPEFLEPEGLEYWQKIKEELIEKYGTNEHHATEEMCKEIGLTESEMRYLSAVGFSNIRKSTESNSLEEKICCYSDMRVGPHGILSIEERLADGKRRYENRKDRWNGQMFEEHAAALRILELQIFSHCTIKPEDINDDSIKSIIEELKL